jgi:catechol 2,3-dioxygenase-like lactoylglutathione lyase family enzyme
MRILPALLLSTAAFAQSSAPVNGMLNYIHSTNDFDRTVAFYLEAFGLDKPDPPRPPNPAVPALINAPGAQLKVAVLRIPGSPFGFELTHFGDIERKAAQPNPSDPGAARLVLRVRTLPPLLEAIKKSGAPIVSQTNNPPSILLRDPDGYLIEVDQTPATADSGPNLLGASMGLSVASLQTTLAFYHGLLGFELTAAPAGEYSRVRRMSGNVPGTNAMIEFAEYKDPNRKPFRLRIPDPGCPAIALRVSDLDGLLKRLKAAGVSVVSAGGVPAQFSPVIRNIFVEDPDGFKVELFEQK